MCVLFVANKVCPSYPLIIIANRDEFHQRPTAKLHQWPDSNITAGRDLEAKGTWLGVDNTGKIAALTNIRNAQYIKTAAPTRGQLVTDYLTSTKDDQQFSEQLRQQGSQYSGFNLLYGQVGQLYAFNNISGKVEVLNEGVHGLSNASLNAPWPKIEHGTAQLSKYLEQTDSPNPDELVSLMQNNQVAPDHQLPKTGVELELERLLAPIFIVSEKYGTRCTTILLFDNNNKLTLVEYSYDNTGTVVGKVEICNNIDRA